MRRFISPFSRVITSANNANRVQLVNNFRHAFFSTTILPSSGSSPLLNSPSIGDIKALKKLLQNQEACVVTDPESLNRYNTDWTRHYKGRSKVVLKPQSTIEVSEILNYCNQKRLGVVPQAGNTGLVGGSTPLFDEVILSVERLNDVYDFDEANGILRCGAGCILQNLHDFARERDYLVPIDLGSKGSCMIGGNVSTNAGGSHYYRFGSLHANVLGLEVVLANGTVLDLMNSNRKNNTGYDLKHLFIGAEGTLGVVTKVILSCPRLPATQNVALLACRSYECVQKTLILAKKEIGETLSAFEIMDQNIIDIVEKDKKIPLDEKYPFYILVESQGSNCDHDAEKMEIFLSTSMECGHVEGGVLAQDSKQAKEIWEIREACNPCTQRTGYTYKYDISLPITDFSDFIEEMKEHLVSRPDTVPLSWGHLVDGNLHFNVTTPGNFEEDPCLTTLIESHLYTSVINRGGSISAEHGIGQSKNEYLALVKDKNTMDVMSSMKNMFDPNGILNPGKFLPNKK